MAMARVFDGRGWTLDQYDSLIEAMVGRLDLAPGSPAPGVSVHWAASTDDGVRAVDVYETRAAADALVSDVIGPIAGELGLPLPEITEYEVHNLLN
jgi:hypothetical protein